LKYDVIFDVTAGRCNQGRLMSTSCNEPITKVMTRICHGCSNGGEQLSDVVAVCLIVICSIIVNLLLLN